MTSFACFLAWLLQLPPVIRLVVVSGRLLDAILAVLIDPETGAVRELEAWALDGVESALQTADACVARAIWLRARQLAGLPAAGPPAPFRYVAPRHLSPPEAMAMRAAHLLDRLVQLETHALGLARNMSLGASLTGARSPAAHPAAPLRACASTLHAPSKTGFVTVQPERTHGFARKTGPPHPCVPPLRSLLNPRPGGPPLPGTRTHACCAAMQRRLRSDPQTADIASIAPG